MLVDDTISFLSGGTVVLGLFGRDDLAADAAVEFSADGYAPVALAMKRRVVPGSTRRSRRPKRAGGTITKPAEETDWLATRCMSPTSTRICGRSPTTRSCRRDDSGRMVLPDS